MQETTLILLRHGTSEENLDPTIRFETNDLDVSLSTLGQLQAKAIGIKLHLLFDLTGITVYHSPCKRAKETCSAIQNVTNCSLCNNQELLLMEQHKGSALGFKSIEDYLMTLDNSKERQLYQRLGYLQYAPDRGENLIQVYQRAGLFVEKYNWFESESTCLVVAHKYLLTMLSAYLTNNLPTEDEMTEWKPCMAKVFKLQFSSLGDVKVNLNQVVTCEL
jgi:broad specificity phosphatase PhoE